MAGETITRALAEDWLIRGAAKDANGDALPLNGDTTIEFRVASEAWRVTREPTLFALATLGDGIELVGDGTAGLCDITITYDARDEATCPGLHRYEWFVIDGDGARIEQDAGAFEITPSLKTAFPTPEEA
jgi:hypothetical protein